MAFYDKFPYTNFQELNLDWIIKAIDELKTEVENYIEINAIKYADPLQWDITTQYEKNTVVVTSQGNAYLSVQPVPSGVNITNTDYWTEIGNFSELWTDIKEAITTKDEGQATTASGARAVHDLVWISNELYEVTQAMTAGAAYIVGSNCEHIDIEDFVNALRATVAANTQAINDEEAARILAVQNEENARIAADGDINDAIDALTERADNMHIYNVLDYGAKGDNVTDDSAAIQAAINACPAHGVVYVPWTGSSYYVHSQIYINKPIIFRGGYYGFEIQESPAIVSVPLFRYDGSTDFILVNSLGVMIENISAVTIGQGIKLKAENNNAPYARFSILKNIYLDLTTGNGHGFDSDSAFKSVLENCVCYRGEYGFVFTNGTSLTFINCWGRENAVSAFSLYQLQYSTLINCCCDDNQGAIGYYIGDSNNISLIGCGCENSKSTAFDISNTIGFKLNAEAVNCNTNNSGYVIYIDGYSTGVIEAYRDSKVYNDTDPLLPLFVNAAANVTLLNTNIGVLVHGATKRYPSNGFFSTAGTLNSY